MILTLTLIATTAEGRDLVLSAPLEPVQSTTVYAGLNGQIRDIRVQMGNMVIVGDTLAVIHRPDLELKEATALIHLKKTRAEENRLNEMHKRGLVSAHQLEIARFDTETAHYHYLSAYTDLKKTTITAPRDGLLAEIKVKPGDRVLSHTPIARIIDPTDLQTHLFVPEDQLHHIQINMPISAVPTAGGQPTLHGRITQISPIIDPNSGTCKITGLFLNAGTHLRPGTLVDITITPP